MTEANRKSVAREELAWNASSEELDVIRALWKRHSIAEDDRDLPGLLSTLTPDCEYAIVGTSLVWRGHEGATRFYRELLGGVPDVRFDLQRIVVGAQGVFEEAILTGTPKGSLFGKPVPSVPFRGTTAILFPWDRARRLFAGERVYVDGAIRSLLP